MQLVTAHIAITARKSVNPVLVALGQEGQLDGFSVVAVRNGAQGTIGCRPAGQFPVGLGQRIGTGRGIRRGGENTRERWLTEWMPEEDRYIAAERPAERVDLRFDGAGAG